VSEIGFCDFGGDGKMDENNDNQNNHQSIGQEPNDQNETEYCKISKGNIEKILEDHKKWLESGGNDGKFANFRKTIIDDDSLKGKNLEKANFRKAILNGANLRDANFEGANFRRAKLNNADLGRAIFNGAILERADFENARLHRTKMRNSSLVKANLKGADLDRANLEEADLTGVEGLSSALLKYTDFTDAKGLLGSEFAAKDITGCILPKNFQLKELEIVKETSQNARKIFFAMLLGCVYSWLTIATTTDVKLLTNTASSPLPIIRTEIPIAWFYIAAPLVLICIYFYFHLYLIKLWETLSGLPAIFPDGKRLDEIAYPWLLNGLVRRNFKLLKKNRPFIAHVQEWLSIFLAWWVVPFTMVAFWLRFIPRHDWWGTGFHIGLIVLSVAFATIVYRLCKKTLEGMMKTKSDYEKFWYYNRIYFGFIVFITFSFSILISYSSINGVKHYLADTSKIKFDRIEEAIPHVLQKVGFDVFANFREKIVSEIPPNYGQIEKTERIDYIDGANLKKRNLNNADMRKAFLVKADFRNAILEYVNLEGANLQKANLSNAYLLKPNLSYAFLMAANFTNSNLQEPNLSFANLQKADLSNANLQNGNLSFSIFRGANLQNAKLQNVRLYNADLHEANLKNVNLKEAKLINGKLTKANLIMANLQESNLYNANLEGANLNYANLRETNLDKANLKKAKLVHVYNLKFEQLSKVKTLYQAEIDSVLKEKVKNCCPDLLEMTTEYKENVH
jgi:uncharacterized protein YjbI with pentapeptide repeats